MQQNDNRTAQDEISRPNALENHSCRWIGISSQFLNKEQEKKNRARTDKHPPLSSRHTGFAVSATSSSQKQALQFPHAKPSIHMKRQVFFTNWTREMLSDPIRVSRCLVPVSSSAARAGQAMLVRPPILAQQRQRETELNNEVLKNRKKK